MKAQLLTNDYFYEGSRETDKCHRELAVLSIDDLIEKCVAKEKKAFCHANDFAFYASGWQSWGFGGEIDKGEYEKKYFPIVPQWKKYFNVSGSLPKRIFGGKKNPKNRKLLAGYFFIYFRWNLGQHDVYLAIASTGNIKESLEDKALPPVKYYVDRKTRKISVTVYSDGKTWTTGEKIASISIFAANDFFELKDTVEGLYAADKEIRFSRLKFLDSCNDNIRIAGWESWYNHYEKINAELIDGDLTCLGLTDNLIKSYFIDKKSPCIFQVDDGWEKGLGDWEADLSRFPYGMIKLAKSIEDKGYVPGLWLAPFIIDWRSDFAKNHRDWILKDENDKPVQAGFNLVWGASFGKEQPGLPYSYYCFDLSNPAVLTYLDSLMEKVINEWGFRYIKLDFLFAGMLYGKFRNPGACYEYYDRAIKILTKRNVNKKGQRVAYLGCGMPFELSFNSFPLSRIGPDTKETWDIDYLRRANFPARTS
nr:alpha-galactosidase [Treponema sp.]